MDIQNVYTFLPRIILNIPQTTIISKANYKLLLTLRWQESIALPISIHSVALFSTMIVFEVDNS